ncbi:MAG: hypothetical protein JSS77_15980 [Acidobacteria bacterium]|nr:hypothetical protein [Acidobacteriota bacterium]
MTKKYVILAGYLGDDKPGKPRFITAQEVLEASGLPAEECMLASSAAQFKKSDFAGKTIIRPSDVLRRKS